MDYQTQLQIEEHVSGILRLLGLDLESSDLKDTPKRVAKFYKEFFYYQDDNIGTVFPAASTVDQMVVVKDIPFYSLCAHHLMVFSGTISVGYMATDQIIGLSKIPRIVRKCASKPQSQEQLVEDIADLLSEKVSNNGIAVYARGVHTCMVMRGVKSNGEMMTSVLRGQFREDPNIRAEFFSLVK